MDSSQEAIPASRPEDTSNIKPDFTFEEWLAALKDGYQRYRDDKMSRSTRPPNGITIAEFSQQMGISKETVRQYFGELEKNGQVQRIKGRMNGHWTSFYIPAPGSGFVLK